MDTCQSGTHDAVGNPRHLVFQGRLEALVTTDTLAQERQNAYGKLARETPVSCALVRARLASASEGYSGVSPGQSGRARSVGNGDGRDS